MKSKIKKDLSYLMTPVFFVFFLLLPFFSLSSEVLAYDFTNPTKVETIGSKWIFLDGPYDVAVDSVGDVYVIDTKIQKYDVGTSSWTAMGSGGADPGEFIEPHGIALDSIGNIYVADTHNNRIQKYDIGTSSWSVLGTGGTGIGQFNHPESVALDSIGNIYVADSYNHRIQKYDVGTSSWTAVGSRGIEVGQFVAPKGISVDSSGNIYVADGGNHRIQKYDVGTSSWTAMGTLGTELGQFDDPRKISVDSSGNIYVTDYRNDRIQKYDVGTSSWTAMGTLGKGMGQFYGIGGVDVDENGNIYVADGGNDRIQKYDAGTSSWTTVGTSDYGLGQFNYPEGVVLDSLGNIYVADTRNNRIQKYDVGTTSWTAMGSFGKELLGQFEDPKGIALDSSDNIYVADTYNYRIQKYDVGTTSWTAMGTRGTGLGQFDAASGIALDSSDNIYVADTRNNRIQKYDIGTSSWSVLGTGGTGIGQFNEPQGISVDSSDNIYVADSRNNRIQKYDVGTTSWAIIGEISGPRAVTNDDLGNVYVIEGSSRKIEKYDVETSLWTFIYQPISDLANSGDIFTFTDINGAFSIYVTDSDHNRLRKFTYYDPPSEPINLSLTPGDRQVLLRWAAPIDNGGIAIGDYQIEYKTSIGTSWSVFADGESINTNTVVTGLTNGVSYDFRISAINLAFDSVGAGPFSNSISAMPVTFPEQPVGVGTSVGNSQISLNWTAPTDNGGVEITDYQVQYKPTGGDTWSTFADGESINTNTVVTGLINGVGYDFRVNAVNSVGPGTLSETVSATPIEVIVIPNGLVGAVGDGAMSLSWRAPELGVGVSIVDYQIEYKISVGTSWSTFADGESINTNTVVTGLTNGVSYDFRVKAISTEGLGLPSEIFTETLLIITEGVAFSDDFENGFDGLWNVNTSGVASASAELLDIGYSGSKALAIISEAQFSQPKVFKNVLLKPNTAYVLTARMRVEGIERNFVNGDTNKNISAHIAVDSWNSKVISLSNSDWQQYSLEFVTGSTGIANISCQLGYDFFDNAVKGMALFDDIEIRENAGVTPKYGNNIRLFLRDSDLTNISNNNLNYWVNKLDTAYDTYDDLVGASPFSGNKINIASINSDVYWGWAFAGNPISWLEEYIAGELTKIDQNDDSSFGILHEMSHDFDGVCEGGCSWNFDGELMANFKMAYFVQTNNIKVSPGYSGNYYTGLEIKNYYQLGYNTGIGSTNYNGDFLTYVLLRIKDQVGGWNTFKTVFRNMAEMSAYTDEQRLNLFLDQLSIVSTQDVRTLFNQTEKSMINAKFGNIFPVIIAVPDAPTGIGASAVSTQVFLNWTAPVDNGGAEITDYQIEYKTSVGTSWSVFGDGESINTNTVVTALTNGVSYNFRVKAINLGGLSESSSVVSATPVAPVEPTVTPTVTITPTITPTVTPTVTITPTPTIVRIGATDISILISRGVFSVGTSKITVTNEVVISVGESLAITTISLADETEIVRSDNQDFEANQISAGNMNKSEATNLPTGFESKALLQWGLPGVTLTFTKAVDINMYVGNEYNGQTLSVLRSNSTSSGWTADGITGPNVCLVVGGSCQFSATKASYYTAVSYTAPVINQPSQSNSSTNNSLNNSSNSAPMCTDVAPVNSPDLFEIKASKGKVKLFYTPSSRATVYAVLYGFKKGDERFGTVVGTINNNKGIQNTDIYMLNPKSTYFFKMAAINGCTVSPWSEWVPIKADRNRTVYKYLTIIKNKIKTLVNRFK